MSAATALLHDAVLSVPLHFEPTPPCIFAIPLSLFVLSRGSRERVLVDSVEIGVVLLF